MFQAQCWAQRSSSEQTSGSHNLVGETDDNLGASQSMTGVPRGQACPREWEDVHQAL